MVQHHDPVLARIAAAQQQAGTGDVEAARAALSELWDEVSPGLTRCTW
jgi:hypothetical protein